MLCYGAKNAWNITHTLLPCWITNGLSIVLTTIRHIHLCYGLDIIKQRESNNTTIMNMLQIPSKQDTEPFGIFVLLHTPSLNISVGCVPRSFAQTYTQNLLCKGWVLQRCIFAFFTSSISRGADAKHPDNYARD